MEERGPRLEGEKPDDRHGSPNGPVSRAGRDGELLPCCSSFTGVGRERDEMRETCEGPLGGACGGHCC